MSYFPKLIELDDLSYEGEPTVQLVHPRDTSNLRHVKTASEALEYIKNVRPIPGKTIILVLAMTAGEFYGPNRNGDAWSERPLTVGNTVIGEADVLPKHYKTFETHANVFKHHLHSDPNKSIGGVLRAFYNWAMHRVELLLALDNRKAENIIQRIHSDEFPAVSMGCRVKFDVCSICGNKAPTRRQYCKHVTFGKMGTVDPSGRQRFVWNPSPVFFDISMVGRPADRHGFMMKKVALNIPEIRSSAILGEHIDGLRRKAAALGKMSDMDKVIQGLPVASKAGPGAAAPEVITSSKIRDTIAIPAAKNIRPLTEEEITHLVAYDPATVLATLSSMGILLTTPEFMQYLVQRADPAVQLPPEMLDRAVAVQSGIYKLLSRNPQILEEIESTGVFRGANDPAHVDSLLRTKMSSAHEKRSLIGEYLYDKLTPNYFKSEEPVTKGNWDLITVRDPRTGRTYQTTRLARNLAKRYAAKQQIKNLAGGAALLAGAAGVAAIPGVKLLTPHIGAAGVTKFTRGYRGYPYLVSNKGERVYVPSIRSDSDFPGTELIEKRGSIRMDPADIDPVLTSIKLAVDHIHHPNAHKFMKLGQMLDRDFMDMAEATEIIGNIMVVRTTI